MVDWSCCLWRLEWYDASKRRYQQNAIENVLFDFELRTAWYLSNPQSVCLPGDGQYVGMSVCQIHLTLKDQLFLLILQVVLSKLKLEDMKLY